MIEALERARYAISVIEKRIKLNEQDKEFLEDQIVFSFREGYRLACDNEFDLKKLDFKSVRRVENDDMFIILKTQFFNVLDGCSDIDSATFFYRLFTRSYQFSFDQDLDIHRSFIKWAKSLEE
jgi:hypothetical protein